MQRMPARARYSLCALLIATGSMANMSVHAQTAPTLILADSYSDREYNNREYNNREYSNREYTNRQYTNRQYNNRQYNNRLYNQERTQQRHPYPVF